MSRYAEPARKKSHWDYLLQEMEWLAKDYGEERRWKMALAKKVSAAVLKHHKMKHSQIEREHKKQEQDLKKIAIRMSKDVKLFWGQVGKLVVYKHEVQIEEIRRQNVEKHMDFMVAQTERYSKMLAEDLEAPCTSAVINDASAELDDDDADFIPASDVNDDEATLDEDVEEVLQEAEAAAVAKLEGESTLPINELLAKYGLDETVFETGLPDVVDDEADDENTDASPTPTNMGSEDSEAGASDTIGTDLEDGVDNDEGCDLSVLVDPAAKELSEKEKALLQKREDRMTRAAASAEQLAPAGWTLETAGQGKKVEVPFIIKASLREYQQVALNWMSSLYDKKLNGILADEMGLGKTLMTISMLAYLALERGIWGPHLIVVPTSVLLNWEIEFKKFCPAFKVLTYYGTQKERKEKRKGWTQQNFFHICITSYKLVVQDQHVFK
jgi:E1A-binding protein p400